MTFSFLAPCPSSGLILHGDQDDVAPPKDVPGAGGQAEDTEGYHDHAQKTMVGANHFFSGMTDEVIAECSDYLDRRLNGELRREPRPKRLR